MRFTYLLSTITFLLVSLLIPVSTASAFDQTTFGWGYKKNKEQNPPDAGEYGPILDKYNSFYVDKSGEKVVYFTFDMGYESGYTEQILDILKKQQVPATFFLAGHYFNSAPELVERMVEEGHNIGNHSFNHKDFTTLSEEKIKEELETIEDKLYEVTGIKHTQYVRPPRGDFSERTLEITEKLGYTTVFWSSAFVDWGTEKGTDTAFRSIIEHIHPGAIILLHSTQSNADALEPLIDELRKRGYAFKSLDYLLWKETLPFTF